MIARCRHCNHTVKDVPIVGRNEQERVAAFVEACGAHLQRAHPEYFHASGVMGGALIVLALLGNFETTDLEVQKHVQQLRADIARSVCLHVPDDVIAKQAAESGIPEEHQATVCELLRSLRDAIMVRQLQ